MVEEAARQFVQDVMVPALRQPRGEPRVRALFERWLAWGDRPGGCFFVGASAELDDRPGPPRDALVQANKDWIGQIATADPDRDQRGSLPQAISTPISSPSTCTASCSPRTPSFASCTSPVRSTARARRSRRLIESLARSTPSNPLNPEEDPMLSSASSKNSTIVRSRNRDPHYARRAPYRLPPLRGSRAQASPNDCSLTRDAIARPEREKAILATGRPFTVDVQLRSPRWDERSHQGRRVALGLRPDGPARPRLGRPRLAARLRSSSRSSLPASRS